MSRYAHRMAAVADPVRLVRLDPVDRIAVLMRVDRDGPDAQLVRRPERPDSDLTAVGDQHLGEHVSNLPRDCYHSETVFQCCRGLGCSWIRDRCDLASKETVLMLNLTVT